MEEEKRSLIKFRNAAIAKGDNLIITDLNLDICRGDFFYLIGRVGSGKTSIIKTIIGEFPLKEGEGEVAGFSLNSL
ncbi:MAG: ATP-binding cassette domain-containing protein, partial [Bacteroidales bacterium]